jgi:hypothetical protein
VVVVIAVAWSISNLRHAYEQQVSLRTLLRSAEYLEARGAVPSEAPDKPAADARDEVMPRALASVLGAAIQSVALPAIALLLCGAGIQGAARIRLWWALVSAAVLAFTLSAYARPVANEACPLARHAVAAFALNAAVVVVLLVVVGMLRPYRVRIWDNEHLMRAMRRRER